MPADSGLLLSVWLGRHGGAVALANTHAANSGCQPSGPCRPRPTLLPVLQHGGGTVPAPPQKGPGPAAPCTPPTAAHLS